MALSFDKLRESISGELHDRLEYRLLYATDASIFREVPAAVCIPAGNKDLGRIISFCRQNSLPLIPRTAGTSLAGQVVGHGIVVDFSKYMNSILELNTSERWVRVQPGVILDDLNRFLEPYGLYFAPETSTGNRCMIGGMVANNSCGSNSLVYGSTRDHTIEISAILSDGSEVVFGPLGTDGFREKCVGSSLENRIYGSIFSMLSDKRNQEEIRRNYPDPAIRRRNTGYALDLLLNSVVFGGEEPFNFCRLLCGAEGTLALFTEIKLGLVDLPPSEKVLACVHLDSTEEALRANLVALEHQPSAVELIDRQILDCTKKNLTHSKNRFFIKGDPGAIMVVEFASDTPGEAITKASALEAVLREKGLGYHYPVLSGEETGRVWALRKAGLGLLANIPGDAKPVAVIEDSAVTPEDLPAFISDVISMLDGMGLSCVYYAHIGTGELHLRPVLNLKNRTDVERLEKLAESMARLVKKFRGSLSGEHGDGRLRGGYIRIVFGELCYKLLEQTKEVWDPAGIFNPGKITANPPIKESLRFPAGLQEPKIKTYFDYEDTLGFYRALEKCNGSGDCIKPASAGGVMCPSYHASRNEYDSTRGRANLLRELIVNRVGVKPFDSREAMEILELCLSCKSCKSECPSSVDMAMYKAEVFQQYYDINGTPVNALLAGEYARLTRAGSSLPWLFNFFAGIWPASALIKFFIGFAQQRNIPRIKKPGMRAWARMNLPEAGRDNGKTVILFCDEFTAHNDVNVGISTCLLLSRLGYTVKIPDLTESGRAQISQGLLKRAAGIAAKNVETLSPLISEKSPLIGIEPSAILSFRDEYPRLLGGDLKKEAGRISDLCFTLDEFIAKEAEAKNIDPSAFDTRKREIYFHGHCHQKALSSTSHSMKMLSLPAGNRVREIECGCCGMAGAFGYKKKNYSTSMQIGELSLFPAVRQAGKNALIAASGTSCRQQIFDGTGRKALHPAEVLLGCLKE